MNLAFASPEFSTMCDSLPGCESLTSVSIEGLSERDVVCVFYVPHPSSMLVLYLVEFVHLTMINHADSRMASAPWTKMLHAVACIPTLTCLTVAKCHGLIENADCLLALRPLATSLKFMSFEGLSVFEGNATVFIFRHFALRAFVYLDVDLSSRVLEDLLLPFCTSPTLTSLNLTSAP